MKQVLSQKSHKSRKTAADQAQAGKPRKSTTKKDKPLDGNPPPVSATASPAPPTALTVLPPEQTAPEKQWWWRAPDSKTRKMADKIAVMDAAGNDDKAIAKKLDTTIPTVRTTRYLAKKNGWWDENDDPIDLEVELATNIDRKIVRNIDAALDGGMTNWQTHEITIAAAKGRGIFKNHENTKSETTEMRAVEIRVVMPAIGAANQQINEKDVGGTPEFIDGEVVDRSALPE